MRKIVALFSVLALTFSVAVQADPILSSFDNESVFFSQDQSLGYAFSSESDATVTALGFWDSDSDGLSADHEVGLYDAAGTLLGLVNLAAGTGDTLIDGFRYANLETSVNLVAGAVYFLAGTTVADDWVFQASNIVMDAGIDYLGSYFYSPSGVAGGSVQFPNTFAADREYMTVNALISVPEPGTLGLIGLGLLGIWGARRKR